MRNSFVILVIGFLAQGFFSARTLIQWTLSERARHVLSPSIFWILSLAGAYLFCLYGWLKHDFAIIFGQFISYYIYLWNLKIKGVWENIPSVIHYILYLTPIVAILYVLDDVHLFDTSFFRQKNIPLWLIVFGLSGQVLFTLRFVYQWIYSRREGKSVLPIGFWIISLLGSLMIGSYGIIRQDPVLIVGQSFGLVAYTRNLHIEYYATKQCKP